MLPFSQRHLNGRRTADIQSTSATAGVLLILLAQCAFALMALGGVQQTVRDLLPKLAAAKVEDRYSAQMELQALALKAARPGAEAERAELAGVLAAKATDAAVPQPAKVWVVRQLEYIGAAESLAALTTLLAGPDAELKECARRALEKNSDPAAGEPLRAALKQGGATAWRMGLMQSLGERRDAQAVTLIRAELSNKDTAPVAAAALGKIADGASVAALWEAYGNGSAGAADSLVVAGNRLLAAGNPASAKEVFQRLYSAPAAPVPVRCAALLGWAMADADSARGAVAEALQQQEPALQLAAVTAASAAFGKERLSAALAPLMPTLSSTAKAYVLDASAEKEVTAAAARDADESVRLAAFARLGQIGSATSLPVLLQAAAKGPARVEDAACEAAARIADPAAGAALAQSAAQGEPRLRAVAMKALALRNDRSAAPALLQHAAESDPTISRAACQALAQLGTDKELDGLVALVLAGKTPGADTALQEVARRAVDKAGATQKLIAQIQSAEAQKLAPLFEALGMLGGKEALAAVLQFAGSSTPEVKDAAIRALGNWSEFAAAKPLLIVAMDPRATRVHNVLAVQAVARLVKAAENEPASARVDTALAALKAAKRDEDKKLLLSALASVTDKAAAEALKPLLRVPPLQREAGQAAMNLVDAFRKPDRAVARDLAQAVKEANISPELNRKASAFLEGKR